MEDSTVEGEEHRVVRLPAEDSCCRRLRILECEQAIQRLWEEGGFSRLSPSVLSDNPETLSMAASLLPLMETIQFSSEKIWLGGTTSDGRDHSGENSLPFFSACLMLLAAGVDEAEREQEEATKWGLQMERRCNGRAELLNFLMENDERLLHFLTALFELLKRNVSLPEMLNPLEMSVLLLWTVEFSETVLLDWLCSEVISIAFLLRFLKFLRSTKTDDVNRAFRTVVHEVNKPPVLPPASTHRIPIGETSKRKEAEESFVFVIHELHGDKEVAKEYKLPTPNTISMLET
ncbi:hypothetical protein M3Y99_01264800 [Aphelenchoides fujianensis]|nr:hypothetical protein M3Y99_01264800 [Aphelenchoides fujianensis]